ncbi:hypothetical protein Dimus_027129 [Dionaea muscipula]
MESVARGAIAHSTKTESFYLHLSLDSSTCPQFAPVKPTAALREKYDFYSRNQGKSTERTFQQRNKFADEEISPCATHPRRTSPPLAVYRRLSKASAAAARNLHLRLIARVVRHTIFNIYEFKRLATKKLAASRVSFHGTVENISIELSLVPR